MTDFFYTPGLPNPPNDPSVDAPLMQTNCNSVQNLLAVNHISFNAENGGNHIFCQMEDIGGSSTPVGTLDTFGTIYTQSTAEPAVELFYTRENSGVGIQLTGPGVPSALTNGSTFLPGGIILKWGLQAGSSSSSVPVSFSPSFPNACLNVGAIPVHSASSPGSDFSTVIVTLSVDAAGFTIGNIGGHTMDGWFWWAIGN